MRLFVHLAYQQCFRVNVNQSQCINTWHVPGTLVINSWSATVPSEFEVMLLIYHRRGGGRGKHEVRSKCID